MVAYVIDVVHPESTVFTKEVFDGGDHEDVMRTLFDKGLAVIYKTYCVFIPNSYGLNGVVYKVEPVSPRLTFHRVA